MKPEEQRIAIAEACGWNSIREQDYDHGYSGNDVRQMWVGLNPDSDEFEQLPDYPNDLNAMHDAEKVLIERGMWVDYTNWLGMGSIAPNRLVVHATAAQRAKAFLRTVDKLEESA